MEHIAGIIAEYNPFHKGHAYHIQETKRLCRTEHLIIIMSGPFVQRGSCAITDKYTRAHAALLAGADLVFELPVLYAASSAELFATGAVAALDRLGIVTHLCFGCETTDVSALMQAAHILVSEPEAYRLPLKKALANGNTFPKARVLALAEAFPSLSEQLPLHMPNSILGLEYCKAILKLHSSLQPAAIQRQGGAYHQAEPDAQFSSAESLRRQLLSGKSTEELSSQLPGDALRLLDAAKGSTFPIFDEDLSAMMIYALMQVSDRDYTPFLDVSKDLSNRMGKHLFEFQHFHQFASILKTKELTYSRICRCLLHIMLGITRQDQTLAQDAGYCPYFRLLGMRKESAFLLNQIQQQSSIPIITNPLRLPDSASAAARRMLELDCHAAHIYNAIAGTKFQHKIECEYTQPFLKI